MNVCTTATSNLCNFLFIFCSDSSGSVKLERFRASIEDAMNELNAQQSKASSKCFLFFLI